MLTQEEIDRIVGSVAGGAANVQDVYPLAPLQEGILFHHLLTHEGDPYLQRALLRFDSRARLDGYLAALQAVIDRHDILRTAVVWDGLREPVQVVWRRAPLAVEELALNPDAGGVLEQLTARFDPRRYRIDIARAPLLRGIVARDGSSGRWVMALLFHHIVCDRVGMDVIFDEIKAHLRGDAARLPQPVRFRDFVAQTRLGISREEHEAFFRDMLSDVAEPTVPYGLTNVMGDGSGITESRRVIPQPLSQRVRAHAQALGVTTASMCHLGWAHVLGALSGRDDVVFGTVLFGRMQGADGTERALGLMINTLPLRLRLAAAGADESVRRTHDALADLMRHEHASLALAQRCSAVAAPTPLFSTLFNYRNSRAASVPSEAPRAWDGIEFLGGGEGRTNYPLTLSVDDLGTNLHLSAQVLEPLDPERICAYMETALERLADALDRAPGAALRNLSVLPERERRQVVVEWNATDTPYPPDRCVHELFEEHAADAPDAVAAVYEDTQLTYGELNARSNRLARYLRSLGVGPDLRVALCVERGPAMVVALLAVLKAGGAYVPLDPSYPAARLSAMLEDSAPVAVLTHAQVAGDVQQLMRGRAVPVLDVEHDVTLWNAESANDLDRGGLTPAHLAYVIYTSGSTGTPKGVMVEHRSVCNLAMVQGDRFDFDGDSRVLQFGSFSFDASAMEVVMALCHGAALHLVAPTTVLAGDDLAATLRNGRISHTLIPPAVLAQLPHGDDFPFLRVLLSGADVVTKALVERWAPGRRFINAYGPTEATVFATLYECDPGAPGNPPMGRPIANVRMYILDAGREPVPIGVAGELYIGGVQVARGYLHRPELTAERFIASPFVAGDRLYKTGDLARYLPDGNIEYLGRNDFQVKMRGFRIELGEIEARLSEYAGIRDAVVLMRQDVPGEQRLVAYYTARDAADVSADALRSNLLAALPEYMVPAAYVRLEALPLTANGKLDRTALPAPAGSAYAARGYEQPVGAVEEAVARIWSELLGVDRVGRHDDFFDLGGHSLVAVRALSRMRRELQIELTVTQLYANPVLYQLAQTASQANRSALPAITRIKRDPQVSEV